MIPFSERLDCVAVPVSLQATGGIAATDLIERSAWCVGEGAGSAAPGPGQRTQAQRLAKIA
jgi:hypothetical protein